MKHWDRRQRSVAEVIWPAFLAAGVGTAVFFANIDPTALQAAFVHPVELSTTGIYTAGFFFFWGVAVLASALSTLLIRTERRRDQFPNLDRDS